VTRRACKIRSNIFASWTPLEASRLIRQMRLVVAVWLAMRHVVTMAAYIFLSLAARQRLMSWGLFVLDRRVPRRMIGEICTSLEFEPPDLDVTYTEKKLFETDLPALPLSTRASTTETTINESFYSTFNSLLARGVAQDANNDQEAVFNACILPQVLQGAANRTLLEPLDVGVLFEDPSVADLEHLWDNKGHEQWSRMYNDISTASLANLRSHQTNEFGLAVARGIEAIAKTLPCPAALQVTIANMVTAWFSPAYIVHRHLNDNSQWRWTENHPVFRLEDGTFRPGLEAPGDRDIVLNAFSDLYLLLVWMVGRGGATDKSVFGWPPDGTVWTAAELNQVMKGARWQKFLEGKRQYTEAAVVVLEYLASRTHYINRVAQEIADEEAAQNPSAPRRRPPALDAIPIAPYKHSHEAPFVSFTYSMFVGAVLNAVAIKARYSDEQIKKCSRDGLPGIPESRFFVPLTNVRVGWTVRVVGLTARPDSGCGHDIS
jgi:hypothetical protein